MLLVSSIVVFVLFQLKTASACQLPETSERISITTRGLFAFASPTWIRRASETPVNSGKTRASMVNACMPWMGLVARTKPSWIPSKHTAVPASMAVTVGAPITVGVKPPMFVVLSMTQLVVGWGPRSGGERSGPGTSTIGGKSGTRSAGARSGGGRSGGAESKTKVSRSGPSTGPSTCPSTWTITGPSGCCASGPSAASFALSVSFVSSVHGASGMVSTSIVEGASTTGAESTRNRSGLVVAPSGDDARSEVASSVFAGAASSALSSAATGNASELVSGSNGWMSRSVVARVSSVLLGPSAASGRVPRPLPLTPQPAAGSRQRLTIQTADREYFMDVIHADDRTVAEKRQATR